MPLMPRMRPFTKMKRLAESPSKRPPISEAQGVKWFQSMCMVCLSEWLLVYWPSVAWQNWL